MGSRSGQLLPAPVRITSIIDATRGLVIGLFLPNQCSLAARREHRIQKKNQPGGAADAGVIAEAGEHQPGLLGGRKGVAPESLRRPVDDDLPSGGNAAAEVAQAAALTTGAVVVNHLEALDHCPTTRAQVRALAQRGGWAHRLWVPEDGECRYYPVPTVKSDAMNSVAAEA